MEKELLKFGFSGSDMFGEMSAEEFAAELAKEGGKGFQPGTYDVEIQKAEHHKNKDTGSIFSAKDPTWLNVKLTLSNGVASKDIWVLVPTQKVTFNEGNSKAPTFMFKKFRQFMAAIGESVESQPAALLAVCKKYFQNPSKPPLVGKTMRIVVGFEGNYIKYISKDEFQICDKDGKPIVEQTFESSEEAQVYASDKGINLVKCSDSGKFYPEILAYLPKPDNTESIKTKLESEDF